MQNVIEHHGTRGAREGMLARDHLIEHSAEREKIGARVEIFAAGLLGRHVGDGANCGSRAGEESFGTVDGFAGQVGVMFGQEFGQAEVENFCRAAVCDKDVGWLDVAMHNAFLWAASRASAS
jgi:hypothetical protein